MKKSFPILVFLLFNILTSKAFAENHFIYPLPVILLSEKAQENKLFLMSLSSDGSGNDKEFARNLLLDKFYRTFPNSVKDIENRFNTFVAFLNITRASRYEIKKTENLIDLYLPVTMSINFANVVTGEVLYSYAYTYYRNYRATIGSLSEKTIIELYKETYKELLDQILQKAKEDFRPFSIDTRVREKWRDYYILDKGKDKGITDDDVLVDQHGNQLKILYAALKYSVGVENLGVPKTDSIFLKFSSESIDEIKKPKILFLSIERGQVQAVPDELIFQFFSEALGKKATFSITARERNFSEVRKQVVTLTKSSQRILGERQLPDYFLRLHFFGPFYVSAPTNKKYASIDNYSVLACADIVDSSSGIVYSKCIEEKISDEVVSGIKFKREDREEIIVKNSLIRLANDLIENIKFRNLEFPVIKNEKNQVIIEDKYNILTPETNLKIFTNLKKIQGIEGNIFVPTWQVDVVAKDNSATVASKILPLTALMPEPSVGDVVFFNSITADHSQNLKILKMCKAYGNLGGDLDFEGFRGLSLCAVSNAIKYPFFAPEGFKRDVEVFNRPGYGFKGIEAKEPHTRYCLEPVWKITQKEKSTDKDNQYDAFKLTVLAGIKIYDGEKIIWKKGLEQNVTINAPKNYQGAMLEFELSKNIFNLLSEISKKIDLRDN